MPTQTPTSHQYIDRASGEVRTERLYHDRLIRLLYSRARESAPLVFRARVGRKASRLAAHFNYDMPWGARLAGQKRFLADLGVDLSECLDTPEQLDTARKVFERRIRYWQCRPMPQDTGALVSPSDARVLVGSFAETSQICIKDNFFRLAELLGPGRSWHEKFQDGDFAVFRLTPDKYHYNHVPAAGRVLDIYEVAGEYHSCNPQAVVELATPYSKNKRVVTILDTDVPGGAGAGLVAMVEVVALMIGEVVQCYSEECYDDPVAVVPGMLLRKGAPKSLYRPGSSTTVLLYQRGRVMPERDLVANLYRQASSRFSAGFGRPLVETDVRARSLVARAFESANEHSGRDLFEESHV